MRLELNLPEDRGTEQLIEKAEEPRSVGLAPPFIGRCAVCIEVP